ncbi:hypothetical protein GQ457_15G017460 [Hibiscus cannabinus]
MQQYCRVVLKQLRSRKAQKALRQNVGPDSSSRGRRTYWQKGIKRIRIFSNIPKGSVYERKRQRLSQSQGLEAQAH